jgi:hypothetical protein
MLEIMAIAFGTKKKRKLLKQDWRHFLKFLIGFGGNEKNKKQKTLNLKLIFPRCRRPRL